MREPTYTLVDMQDENDRYEGQTLQDLKDFLNHIWANRTYGEDEEEEEFNFDDKTFEQLQYNLEGIDYYAEEEN